MDNMLANFKILIQKSIKSLNIFIQNSKTRVAINSKNGRSLQKSFSYNFNVIHNGVDKKKILESKSSKAIK